MCALLHWEPNYEKNKQKKENQQKIITRKKKKNGMDFRGITFYGE